MNEKGKRNLKKRRKAHVKRHDIIRDKLEHKRIKKEPAGSERAYRDLADHAATGMATVDLKGRFTYVNRVMADFIGHPAQDLMGRLFKDCIHPEDRSRIARLFLKAVLLRRPPSEVELRAMRPDGSVRHLLMRPWPMRAGGNTIGFSAVTVDVTERKQMEDELRRSEERFRMIFQSSPIPAMITSIEGPILDVNEAWVRMTGFSRREAIGHSTIDLGMVLDPKQRGQIVKDLLKKKRLSNVEMTRRTKSGELRDILNTLELVELDGQKRILNMQTDVTERKRIEQEIQRSRRFLEEMGRGLPDLVFVKDKDLKYVLVSDAACDFVGKPRREILGRTAHDLYTKEFADNAEKTDKEVFERGVAIEIPDLSSATKDGKTRVLHTRKAPLKDSQGNVTHIIAITRDITERRQMEDELRASEERYRSLVERMHDALLVFGEDRRIEFANRQVEAFVGYKPEEIIGEKFDKLLTREGLKGIADRYERRRRGESVPSSYELQAVAKDGTVKDFEISAALFTIEGKPKTIAAFKDVTERKLMEQELRESETRYRGLFENSKDTITINTPDGKYLGFNQAYLNLLGYSRDEMPELNASNSYANRADRDRFRQEVERNGFVKDFEVKLRRKDGAVRDCLLTSTAWRNEQGQIIGYQGIVRDITDRKRMEEQYKTILQTALDGFWRVDASGRFLDVNDAYARMIGYSRSELLTMRIQDVEAKETAAEIAEHIRRMTATGSDRFETRHRRRDGQIIDIEVSVNYLPGDGGQLFVFLREITERRRAEEMLRLSEAKLRALHRHTKELAVAKTIEEVAKQTLDAMEFTLGFDVADFCTVEKDRIRVRGSRGIQAAPKLWEWPLEGPGVVVKSVETKKTLRVPDTRKEPSFVDRRTLSETEKPQLSELTVPVLIDNTVVGVLNVESSELNAFTEGDQELLETLATHVASALGRLRQVDALEELVEGRTRELRESEEKFRRIYNTSLSAIYTTTLAGDILDMNPAGVSMLGYDSSDELRKVNIASLYVTRGERARFIELANQGHVRGFETQFRRKDDKILDVLANAHVLRDDRNQIAGFQLSLTDITEHKRMERMRDEFVADVTDELLTPLVSIKGYIDYVLKEKQTSLPEDTASSLEAVKRNTDRLLDLTNALVDIRRMESGRLELDSQPLDLREIVEQCIEEAQSLIAEKQSLRVQLPEGPLPVQGDPARVSQILMNLLSNAAKYAPEGEITLRVKTMEDAIEVQVSDTGIGIRKEDLPRIFEPFAAIKKPTYVKGAGLGLSIAKGLVEAHEGKIWAESPGEGKGATFVFTLPRRRGGS